MHRDVAFCYCSYLLLNPLFILLKKVSNAVAALTDKAQLLLQRLCDKNSELDGEKAQAEEDLANQVVIDVCVLCVHEERGGGGLNVVLIIAFALESARERKHLIHILHSCYRLARL